MKTTTSPKSTHLLLAGTVVWLLIAATGMMVLTEYSNTAGAVADIGSPLPAPLAAQRSSRRYTMFMFVHPKCPCSRASVSELARLMTACHEHLATHVYFFQPADQPNNWSHTGLWESSERIPGVTVAQDIDGRSAGRLQVGTSGEVLLYDPQGELVFHGGITSSRGHEGDNIGRTAVERTVLQQRSDHSATPVFGCSILNPQTACRVRVEGKTK